MARTTLAGPETLLDNDPARAVTGPPIGTPFRFMAVSAADNGHTVPLIIRLATAAVTLPGPPIIPFITGGRK